MIGLFFDKELQHPLSRTRIGDKLVWIMDFGKINAGENRTFVVYVENQSIYALEDLKIIPLSEPDDGAHIRLSANTRDRLEMNEIHRFAVKWETDDDARLGRKKVALEITGYLTE